MSKPLSERPVEEGAVPSADPVTSTRLGGRVRSLGRHFGTLGRACLGGVRRLAWGLLGACAVLMLAWAALLWLILPRADQWRLDVAEQATRALGVPVQIGQLHGEAQGLWPVLSLRDVRLLDRQGRVGLRLPQVTARLSPLTLSPMSLWQRQLVLGRLTLLAPELAVRRDTEGRWHVAGLQIEPSRASASADGAMLDWVMSQSRIEIRQGTVLWQDELRGGAPLALREVELRLTNRPGLGQRLHDVRLQATPPAAFGERIELRGRFQQPLWLTGPAADTRADALGWWQQVALRTTRAGDLASWRGEVTASLPRVDVQTLRQHVSLPVQVAGGHGRVLAAVGVHSGLVTSMSLDVDVAAVQVQLARDTEPLAFRRLQGRVALAHDTRVTRLTWTDLAFELDEGLTWPRSSASLEWRHASWPAGGGLTEQLWALTQGGDVRADRLDLALLARLANRLPLASSVRTSLADLAPQGVVEDLRWQWEGRPEAPQRYTAAGRVRGLAWAPDAASGRPGLAGADVTVTASEQGGEADLSVAGGWMAFPGVFELPEVPLDRLRSRVTWRMQPGASGQPAAFELRVREAEFANPDARGRLSGRWQTGDGAKRLPGRLQLDGELQQARADRVWRYLPLEIPKDARDYVQHALREGKGERVVFEVRGDLDAFPFKDDRGGRFRVTVPVRQLHLDYVPASLDAGHWPAFTALDGELRFEGQRMLIRGARGRLGGLGSGGFRLQEVEGRIDDLGADEPHLMIQGRGDGPLDDMLRFLSASPVGGWTGDVMSQSQATGSGTMQLSLDIPLNHTNDTRVRGQVQLAERDAASLRLMPGLPTFQAVRGRVAFTEQTLQIQAETQLWGQPFVVEGGVDATGQTRIQARGSISGEGLRQAHEWPALKRLGQHAQGETPVAVLVTVPTTGPGRGQPEVVVTSTLQGLAVHLPAPLNKLANASWPLKVVHRADDPDGRHDAIVVDLGAPVPLSGGVPWLHVDLRRDVSQPRSAVTRGIMSLVQAGAGLPALPAMPPRGIAAQAFLDTVDVDAWLAAATAPAAPAQAQGALPGVPGAVAPKGGANPTPPDAELEDYLPDTVALKATALSWQGRTLRDLQATVAHPDDGLWRVQLNAQQAAGQLEWLSDPASPSGALRAGRLVARLSRLSVPASEARALTERATARLQQRESTSVPALDVVVDDFEWRGIPLGRIEVQAVNRPSTQPGRTGLPEWRLDTFRISNADAELRASGQWTAPESGRTRSAFGFQLDLANSGTLLARLGLPQTLKGGRGTLSGQISWAGSPLEPDPASMSGDVAVQIAEGRFLKADPGMAKLLGVLSLQSLPRRLTLDFRDVFQQGFGFDRIDGQVTIDQGVARTRALRMRGVQALVLMDGQADLARETQDLHVYVLPDLNAGGASLAYAAINPVVGLGTFLAQVLLRKQVSEASAQAFRVTGSWAQPQVEKVRFEPDAAEAAGEAQPAAPPAPPAARKPS